MIQKLTSRMILHLVGNRNAKGLTFSHQLHYYKELKERQWLSLEENLQEQARRLYDLVRFSICHVPYYRDLGFSMEEFSPENIFETIEKFPILTKEIIRQEGERLFPDISLNDWTYMDTSGGTTGAPVKFRHSGRFFDMDQGAKLLYDEWAGRKIGDRQIRLWGNERDIMSGKSDWKNKIYRWMRNETFLNTFVMTEEKIEQYIEEIKQKKPEMILAYVQSAEEIAKYLHNHHQKIEGITGVMTSTGALPNNLHDFISESFGRCPVLNRYGSREMGDMACSCDKNEGLHINTLSCFLEIVDDDGNRCRQGEYGQVLTTLLMDYSMPMIRYSIGDVAAFEEKQCSCGRGLPMLKEVKGRVCDWFKSSDGRKVHGEYFTHLFYTETNIKQFQVIQEALDLIRVKLVINCSEWDKEAFQRQFTENLYKVLGDIPVVFEYVEDIPVTASGKRAYTISKI